MGIVGMPPKSRFAIAHTPNIEASASAMRCCPNVCVQRLRRRWFWFTEPSTAFTWTAECIEEAKEGRKEGGTEVQTTPLTVTPGFLKNILLILKILGYSDTPLIVTVFAVPEGVTLSGEYCTEK